MKEYKSLSFESDNSFWDKYYSDAVRVFIKQLIKDNVGDVYFGEVNGVPIYASIVDENTVVFGDEKYSEYNVENQGDGTE